MCLFQVDLAPTVAMTGNIAQASEAGTQLARGVQVVCGGMHTVAMIKVRGQLIIAAAGLH